MSGGNCPETPRQKMIGMMYLMLTAMLALNVSGDLLNAFTLVDKSIRSQIASTDDKLGTTYANFDAKTAENEARFKPKYDQALAVKAKADSLYNFIQDFKKHMTAIADGVPEETADPAALVNTSDQDKAGQVMVVQNWRGGAKALREAINTFREDMINLVKSDSVLNMDTVQMNSQIHALQAMLNTDDPPRGKDGEQKTWAAQNFEHLPLAATFGLLSAIQSNVRNAETDVVNSLYKSIDAASFKFNKLEALVIPEAQYVIQGGTYKADIMLAAYDETMVPEVVVDNNKLEVVDGRGKYSVPASSIGKKQFSAMLSVPDPVTGKPKYYPAKAEYEVGAPSLVVSATKMNAMYRGLPNPIEVSVAGVSPSDLQVSASGGSLTRDGSGYVVRPSGANKINISVTSNAGGKTQNFGSKEFRVYDVPNPEVKFVVAGSPLGMGKPLSKGKVGQAEVQAVLENFVFDVKFEVKEFTVGTVKNGFEVSQKNSGPKLQKATADLIKSVSRKGKIFIEGVKAVGPDGKIRPLNGVSVTIEN